MYENPEKIIVEKERYYTPRDTFEVQIEDIIEVRSSVQLQIFANLLQSLLGHSEKEVGGGGGGENLKNF